MNEKLRAARLEKGWSQEAAADAVQVAPRTYQRWESGETHPNFESRKLLREAFGITDEELGFTMAGAVKLYERRKPQMVTLDLSSDEYDALSELIKAGGNMALFDPAKRKTLETLATALGIAVTGSPLIRDPEPWERLNLAAAQPAGLNQKTLDHLSSLVRISWELSNSSELDVAEKMLPQFLPRLLQVAHSQPEAAVLAAQGLRLQGILAAHKLQLEEKIIHSEQAVAHARFSKDGNALVASLTELAVAYKYGHRPHLSLQTYQEALTCVEQASPLLQSRVYAASASAFAKAGRKREARFYLDLAHETFPSRPERDPSAAFADYGVWLLIFYTGLVHLDLGEHQQAWDAFDQIRGVSIAVPERNRLEIINQQGKAAIVLKDRDKYALCLEEGLTGSIALGSKKRFDEALSIFQQDLPGTWRTAHQMKGIAEHYRLVI
jgi:transcriptional regulator with XRE-family HTH domain